MTRNILPWKDDGTPDVAQAEQMKGGFPHTCSRCGAICENVAELADPDAHRPVGSDA
jgi:hypothetical protein